MRLYAGEGDRFDNLSLAVDRLGEVALHMATTARSKKVLTAFAHATPFMKVTGDAVMGWMLLWRARIAAKKLSAGPKKKDIPFYEGQIKSAQFIINSLLPATLGEMNAILASDGAAMEISEDAFGGK